MIEGWQDIAIASMSILFAYALGVQVYHGFKIKRSSIHEQTSLIFTVGSGIIAYAFYTLNLPSTALISLVNGIMWFSLFIQRIVYKNH